MFCVHYKISIVGYNKSDIQKQIILFSKIFSLKSNTSLKKSSLITMLRAPQINKSSREQFSLSKYKQEFSTSLVYNHRESTYSFEKYLMRLLYFYKKPNVQVSCTRVLKSSKH
jgi:ribosomal protein S10